MKFISTNGKAAPVSFGEAALQGLAPDGGLYIPDQWPQLSEDFIENIRKKSLPDISYEVSKLFVDELDSHTLRKIVEQAINFEAPLVQLDDHLHILELFHGPTLAFKDFGARFMSRTFSALRENRQCRCPGIFGGRGHPGMPALSEW